MTYKERLKEGLNNLWVVRLFKYIRKQMVDDYLKKKEAQNKNG